MKATQLADMDNPPHACHTWTGACLIGPEAAALWHELLVQGCYGNWPVH